MMLLEIGPGSIAALIIAVVIALVIIGVIGRFIKLWIQAYFSKADVTMFDLIGMSLRKVDPRVIVLSKIRAVRAGLAITTAEMENHYLSGGHVPSVITALIAANSANIPLTFRTATAIDLAGRDILQAVQTSVNPKVIDCPNPASGRQTIDAVAKDGIQVKAKARVTVRANIDRLVGGATEETIIARVGEGIVTTIGSSGTYKDVLENPDTISQKVLAKGLD
ncbi:MAG: flotillin-like FloA family protein, partial [Planctomycetes bacterium]|nr:flotillin-like FloA family protein [Planctomycetota bacterium]